MAIGTALAIGLGSVAGGAISAIGANKAAKTQAAAASDANAVQLYMFDRSVELTEPQREIGNNALAAMSYEMGLGEAPEGYQGFTASPSYQFALDENQKALERNAAARGMRLSSATLKDAARFGQGLASQEYGNYYNRLASLGGAGQTATNQQIAAGQNYANAYGNNTMAAGAARASGYQGQANAFNSTLNNMFSIYGAHQAGMFS